MRGNVFAMGVAFAGMVGAIEVPEYRHFELCATNDVVVSELALEGTLDKSGAGVATLSADGAHSGTLNVDAGGVVLSRTVSETAPVLSATLRQSAALWLDASKLAADAEVDAWLDVRETELSSSYPRAILPEGAPSPVVAVRDAMRHVDFGAYGSDRWLKWIAPDGTQFRPSSVRHLFLVFGCFNGLGQLVGDCTWNVANSGRSDFDWGYGTVGVARLFRQSSSEELKRGGVWLDGRKTSGLWTWPDPRSFHLLEVATAGDCTASNFCNDRNTVNRQGGGQICECLVFTNALSVGERMTVADYLRVKWFGTNVTEYGAVTVAPGATAQVEVPDGDELKIGDVSGYGDLVKRGSGMLNLTSLSHPLDVGVKLKEGGLRLENASSGEIGLVLDDGGQTLSVTPSNILRGAEAAADEVVKTGYGTLCVASVSAAVKRIRVQQGRLRLRPRPRVDGAEHKVAQIVNPGFEEETEEFGANHMVAAKTRGWTFSDSGNAKSGLTKDGSATWCPIGSIPEGRYALFLQYNATASTTVSVPVAGRYRLSFLCCGRNDNVLCRQHSFKIAIGGVDVATVKSVRNAFVPYTYVTPPLSAGEQTLTFQGLNPNQNRASVIDDIRLTLVEPVDARRVEVANGGFECGDPLGTDETPAAHSFTPGGTGWTFSEDDTAGVAEVFEEGMTGFNITPFTQEGRRFVFMRNGGWIAQTVQFPAAGTYLLTLYAARRARGNTLIPQFIVSVGGDPVSAPCFVKQYHFAPQSFVFDVAPDALSQEIRVASLNDADVMIDDVSIRRYEGVALMNGDFETLPAALEGRTDQYTTVPSGTIANFGGWKAERAGDGKTCGISEFQGNFGDPRQGVAMAFFQGMSYMWQAVTLPRRGVYAVRFDAAARSDTRGHSMTVYWNDVQTEGSAKELHDWTVLGSYRTYTGDWRAHEFRLTATRDNATGTLMFHGDGNNGVQTQDAGSLLDNVRIEYLGMPEGAVLAKDTGVEVASGATLELAYWGTNELASVRLGGHAVQGVADATTHPGFIVGPGAVFVRPRGTVIIIR